MDTSILPLAGRRIACFTRYDAKGPSSRQRFMLYAPYLRSLGATVNFYPLLSDDYLNRFYAGEPRDWADIFRSYARRLGRLARVEADLAWIEKELFPFLPAFTERALEWRGIRYVVDFDDAVFHNYDLRSPGLVRSVLGNKFDPLLRNSALVTAGNAYLADYARKHGARKVAIVPTVVDTDRYPCGPAAPGERIRLGWIGTKTNAHELRPVIEAANALAEQIPLTLVTVGIDLMAGIEVPLEVHPWSEETEGGLVGSFDIGIMPLADEPWERGKCGYKLIQCMAAARPVIASDVGVNRDIVTANVGRLARTPQDWVDAIRELARNPALRLAMGRAARARVERHYSLMSMAPVVGGLLADILSSNSGDRGRLRRGELPETEPYRTEM